MADPDEMQQALLPTAAISGSGPAPAFRRVWAGLLDLVVLLGTNAGVALLTVRLTGLPLSAIQSLPTAPLVTFLLILDAAYLVLLTAVGGQTLGKMALGSRVEAVDGSPVTLPQACLRTLGLTASLLTLGLGFVGLLKRSGRTLHDWLADTRVVALESVESASADSGSPQSLLGLGFFGQNSQNSMSRPVSRR